MKLKHAAFLASVPCCSRPRKRQTGRRRALHTASLPSVPGQGRREVAPSATTCAIRSRSNTARCPNKEVQGGHDLAKGNTAALLQGVG